MTTGLITLRCGPATAVDIARIPLAIREAGFQPENMNVAASGSFDKSGDTFTPIGWKEGIRLAMTQTSPPTDEVRIESAVVGWSKSDASMDTLRLTKLMVR